MLAYQFTTVYETTQPEGVVHGMDNPPTAHGLKYMADIWHDNSFSTGWSSPLTATSQARLLRIDPRRERWEPKEWEVDSYGWIRRRKDEDVGMYSLASEWMGKWKIRRLEFEDRTPELLESQPSSKSKVGTPGASIEKSYKDY